MKKPNILLICSDQHHHSYLGCEGHPHVATPNLDSLAADGVVFDRAYCNSPICTPSRMSFISGKYVHQCKDWMICVPSNPDTLTWGRHLHESGYHSAMYGKMDFCGPYQDGGFTEHKVLLRRPAWSVYPRNTPVEQRLPGYKRPGKREQIEAAGPFDTDVAAELGNPHEIGFYGHDLKVTQWAERFLRSSRTDQSEKPWALSVGLLYPHWPFRVPLRYYNRYFPERIDIPNNALFPNDTLHPALRRFQESCDFGSLPRDQIAQTIAVYSGMVTAMDEMIGRIIDALKESGQFDNTYIIYTSDHGESLGEHGLFYKQCSYEGSVRVPLIVRGPGLQAGARVSRAVSLIDMYPTITEIAEIEPREPLPGTSWLPLAAGDADDRPGYVFSEFHANFFPNAWYMLVDGDYKYTYYVKEAPSLYNMVKDPGEETDLASSSEEQPRLERLEALLRSIVDPEKVDMEAKSDLGLIGPGGDDLTERLSAQELLELREKGEMPPEPAKIR